MTLHEHRGRFEQRLIPFVEWCARRGIDPNTLTIVSLILTFGSAGAFYLSSAEALWWLVVGSVLLAIGATLDSADGLLARITDQTSALGDYLDHAFDRFADVVLLIALAFSPWVPLWIGLLAVTGTLLTSYMGTQAQAVGVGRDYGGLLGRADRIFLLTWAPVFQVGLEIADLSIPCGMGLPGGVTVPCGLNLLYLALAWIALAGNITAVQRFWGAYQDLAADGEG